MALVVQQSLFEAGGGTPMVESARWIEGVMLGEIALGVCVIALAFIGTLMLTGRLPLREGARIVVGCFVLLAAPLIAAAFMSNSPRANDDIEQLLPPFSRSGELSGAISSASADTHSGASLRED